MKKEEIYKILNEAYFSENPHERRVLAQVEDLFVSARTFVDVGASLGQYTRFASQTMPPSSTILAIEADPIRFEELARNCQTWSESSGLEISCRNLAISDIDGPITFYTTQSNVSGGLFIHPVQSPDVEWTELTVEGVTLDSLFPTTAPDLIKMDVEGAELRVLRGAQSLLSKKKTVFLTEVHSWADPQGQANRQEVFSYMRDFGYHRAQIAGQVLFHPHRLSALKWTVRGRLSAVRRRIANASRAVPVSASRANRN